MIEVLLVEHSQYRSRRSIQCSAHFNATELTYPICTLRDLHVLLHLRSYLTSAQTPMEERLDTDWTISSISSTAINPNPNSNFNPDLSQYCIHIGHIRCHHDAVIS